MCFEEDAKKNKEIMDRDKIINDPEAVEDLSYYINGFLRAMDHRKSELQKLTEENIKLKNIIKELKQKTKELKANACKCKKKLNTNDLS
jgi:Sec-independent protein translocase protein TatA